MPSELGCTLQQLARFIPPRCGAYAYPTLLRLLLIPTTYCRIQGSAAPVLTGTCQASASGTPTLETTAFQPQATWKQSSQPYTTGSRGAKTPQGPGLVEQLAEPPHRDTSEEVPLCRHVHSQTSPRRGKEPIGTFLRLKAHGSDLRSPDTSIS